MSEKCTKKALFNAQYHASVTAPEQFWHPQIDILDWIKKPTHTIAYNWDPDKGSVFTHWFDDGVLNIAYNCLDRHVEAQPDKIALIWQGENEDEIKTFTYRELWTEVCSAAAMLKAQGIGKGSMVALFLPMVPQAVIAMLACARIGAIHSVIFSGLSAHAVATRLIDLKPQLLITATESTRNGKKISTLEIARQARTISETSEIKISTIVIHKNMALPLPQLQPSELWWHEQIQHVHPDSSCEPMNAEDPLFVLYTSGSTGKPKGLVHTTAGYILYAALTHRRVFDLQPQDVYWCTADIGWITGHSYVVYGPLCNGATTLIFEGTPTYPTPDRYWRIIDRHRVHIFYTAPTVIRTLAHAGPSWLEPYTLASLRILGSVGEPLDPTTWHWYHTYVGKKRCHIADTWWQTETGGCMLAAVPDVHEPIPGSVSHPFFGIHPRLVPTSFDHNIQDLCIDVPWPGIARTIHGDHDLYVKTYFTAHRGMYTSGDGATVGTNGNYYISGRIDDVINVSGHRTSATEVEAAISGTTVAQTTVVEAAVVGAPHPIKGECLTAFVVCIHPGQDSKSLLEQVNLVLRHKIGPIVKIERIYSVSALPKTRSGKVMRRLLRKMVCHKTTGDELGDLSTLLNPEIITEIVACIDDKKIL